MMTRAPTLRTLESEYDRDTASLANCCANLVQDRVLSGSGLQPGDSAPKVSCPLGGKKLVDRIIHYRKAKLHVYTPVVEEEKAIVSKPLQCRRYHLKRKALITAWIREDKSGDAVLFVREIFT